MVDVRSLMEPERIAALAVRGLPVALTELDSLTRGLLPGALWALIGTSGAGRTVLACQLASGAAQAGANTALILGQDPTSTAASNLLCAHARVPEHLLAAGRLDPGQAARTRTAAEEIAGWPLRILTPDEPTWELSDSRSTPDLDHWIASRTRRTRRAADVLVVDDLDLLINRPITDALAALRRWGKASGQTNVVTLPEELCLLNGDLSPTVRRETDVAVRLRRPDLHNVHNPRAGEADLHVLGHRQGPTSVITVAFEGHYRRFADLREGPHQADAAAPR